MKNTKISATAAATLIFIFGGNHSSGAVVSVIDAGGDVDITTELGSFSSSDMEALILATNNPAIAGVLDSEGSFNPGDFSNDDGPLSDKITGASRYGRGDGVASKASGARWGFISGAAAEIWTPSAGLTHLGLITTPAVASNELTVTVTFDDLTTSAITATAAQNTSWIGFHEAGKTITQVSLAEVEGGSFANYDDVSLVFIPEPSISTLTVLSLVGLCGYRKRVR